MAESLRERGRLPRYDPTAFGGIPLIGDPQSGIHYPPNWLHALGSEDGGPAWFGWWILIHLCIGGFGVSWWLRGQGHSPAARLAGALTFALSGKWLLHVVVAGHVIFAPLVWIPWQLGLIDRLEPPSTRRERSGARFTSCAMLAVVTALAITGLHPQLLLYSQTLVALYAAAWLAGRRPAAAAGRGLATLAAASLLGLGLAAVYLLPVLDSRDLFVRAEALGYETAGALGLPVSGLAGLLLPDQAPWAWEGCVFVGAFALSLASFAPWREPRRGVTLFFLVLFTTTVLYALGEHAPLHRWMFDHVPGYDLFRLPRRGLLIAGIPLAYLAASGLDALCQTPPTLSKRLLAAVEVGAAGWLLATFRSPDAAWAAAALALPALCVVPWPSSLRTRIAALAVLLVLADGVRFIANRIETRPLEEILGVNRVAQHLAGPLGRGRVLALNGSDPREISALGPAYATPAGIESVRGYNPLIPRATYRYLVQGVARREPDWRPATAIPSIPIESRRHLDLFNTRWVVAYERQAVDGLELNEVVRGQRLYFFQLRGDLASQRDVFVYRNTEALPRAWLVRTARWVAGEAEAIAEIPRFDPRREVLVDEVGLAGRTYPGDFREVAVTHRGDEIEIDVDAGAGGFLVLSEIAYAGWRARMDGAPVPIHCANGIFQTVELGPGSHRLRFEYLPRSFEVGRGLTAGSMVLALGMLIAGRGRRSWRIGIPAARTPSKPSPQRAQPC